MAGLSIDSRHTNFTRSGELPVQPGDFEIRLVLLLDPGDLILCHLLLRSFNRSILRIFVEIREFQQLPEYPVRPLPYHTIYLSKFILVCAISAMTQIWFALLFIASGKLIGLPGLPPADLCFWMIRGLAGAFVIAALQFLAATEIRNFATPIAIGLVGGVTGMIAANTRAGLLWPYSQMLLGMNSNKSEDVLGQNAAIFFVICVVYLLGVSLIGIKRIKRNN